MSPLERALIESHLALLRLRTHSSDWVRRIAGIAVERNEKLVGAEELLRLTSAYREQWKRENP